MSGNVPWLTPQGAVGYLEEVARSFDERAKNGRAGEAVRLLADGHESLRLSVERGNDRLIRMTERAEAAEAECARLQQALDHYGNEDHWEDVSPPVSVNTAGYLVFEYAGGEELPWKIAREALAGPDTPADSQEPPAWETLHDGVLDLIDRKRADSQEDKT